MIRAANSAEIEHWDELVLANPDGGNLLQSKAFAETKARFGWQPFYAIDDQPSGQLAVVYLAKRLPYLGELWYATKGPGVKTVEQLHTFLADTEEAKQHLKLKAFALKVEPELPRSAANQLAALGLIKVRNIQFNYATVVIDLKPTEDEIIASFKQKTRYNIRLAERKGVVVKAVEASAANLRQMYQLMRQTADRTGVFLRSYDYFDTFWRLHAEANCGQLFPAELEGKVVAGVFATFLGPKALYKDGGSGREHGEVQAPALLQWEVMRWLKRHGVTEYDLHGVPASDENQPDHPRYGLWRFKSGFCETVTEYVGTWDWPLDKTKYRQWQQIGERLAAGYNYRVKKDLLY